MLEHLSPDAHEVVAVAQQEAMGLGHEYVGTEHLLLALVSLKGRPRRALESLGVRRRHVQSEVERVIGRGEPVHRDELPFTPAAEGALRRSGQEVEAEGREQADSGHLLLGIAGQGDGLAARILDGLDISLEEMRSAIAEQR